MTTGQILWGLNSFLFIICFFFVRIWINSLDKTIGRMELQLNKKLDAFICNERNASVKLTCSEMARHRHAPMHEDGHGGEVILP